MAAGLDVLPKGNNLKPAERARLLAELFGDWKANPTHARQALARADPKRVGIDLKDPALTDDRIAKAAAKLTETFKEMAATL
jgi:hypothetical protein